MLLAVAVWAWWQVGAAMDCGRPIDKAPVIFPSKLLQDFGSKEHMFSGYVNVTEVDFLFYWFVEAKDVGPNAPVVLWSNGGPGCTSMEGATTEIGPLLLKGVKTGAGYTGRLSSNPFAWNRRAHILFIDQPRYVGYSTGSGPFVLSSKDAAADLVQFIRGWRRLFPNLQSSKFILASESYGGHYVPAWANAIFDFNQKTPSEEIRIAGVVLSNTCIDRQLQGLEAFKRFAKKEWLLPNEADPSTIASARFQVWEYKKFVPNTYDYRRVSSDACCGCMGYNYSDFDRWFSDPDVRKALNVCGTAGAASFGGCGAGCIAFPKSFGTTDTLDNVGTLARVLESNIPVLMVYGMTDMTCNYEGGYAIASALRWKGADLFAKSNLQDIYLNGEVAGQEKSGGGLTWIQIKNAGHMNPADNPRAALFAFSKLFDDLDKVTLHDETFQTKDEEFIQPGGVDRIYGGFWIMLPLGLFTSMILMLRRNSQGLELESEDFTDGREIHRLVA